MSSLFFTSDTHFFHEKMAGWRGFASVEEMNEHLVALWNETVRPNDLIYHLGDVTFGKKDESIELLKRLHGQKHFIRGNHDGVFDKVVRDAPKTAVTYNLYREIHTHGEHLVLFHFPITSWHNAHYGYWHLHGHCHGRLSPKSMNGPMLDVGVDNHPLDFRPWAFEEIAEYMRDWTWVPIDQHGEVENG